MRMMPERSHLLHVNMRDSLPVIDRGEGICLIDQDGRRYIDGSSGPGACSIGHGNAKVADAMAAQARRAAFVYRSHFTSDAIEQFARLVSDMAPPALNRVLFTNSGSDAVEIAARIGRQYHLARGQDKRYLMISRCGLTIYPGGGTVDGFRGDHVLVAPPLIMQRPEIDLMVDILDRAMGETADILLRFRLPSP